ncbi:uncharacterized protein TNCV_4643501 [Trichonephila clavipes]|nr:uncharacterized protein TNCV_4643501 [Trichonephila clavipes]
MGDPICYELRIISIATGTSVKCYSPKSFRTIKHAHIFQRLFETSFQPNTSIFSPYMSPIEHVWDLVARCLARDSRPAASRDELLLRIQAIWNSLLQADNQN